MSLVGQVAPEFVLDGVYRSEFGSFALKDYAGQWVVLLFYPLDFTFVCPTELQEFDRRREEFEELGAQVLSVSVDSKYTHLAWQQAELGEVSYPMLSDLTKRVTRAYGILLKEQGVALRGLFIVDPKGLVQYEVVHGLEVGRSVDETLRVLQALQSGSLCPVNWQPGEADLGKA